MDRGASDEGGGSDGVRTGVLSDSLSALVLVAATQLYADRRADRTPEG